MANVPETALSFPDASTSNIDTVPDSQLAVASSPPLGPKATENGFDPVAKGDPETWPIPSADGAATQHTAITEASVPADRAASRARLERDCSPTARAAAVLAFRWASNILIVLPPFVCVRAILSAAREKKRAAALAGRTPSKDRLLSTRAPGAESAGPRALVAPRSPAPTDAVCPAILAT